MSMVGARLRRETPPKAPGDPARTPKSDFSKILQIHIPQGRNTPRDLPDPSGPVPGPFFKAYGKILFLGPGDLGPRGCVDARCGDAMPAALISDVNIAHC